MTTLAPTVPARARTVPTPSAPRRVPFHRLAEVELRKQVDTRAGRWLLACVVLVNTALITLMLLNAEPGELTWQGLTMTSTLSQLLLLPLIGVLAATSEWSQRTALTTFALEPRRTRVNAAKLVSAVALGLGVTVLTLAASAVLNVVGLVWRDGDGSWSLEWAVLGGSAAALVLLVVQGVAFGLALLSTPAAIVAYLVLPTAWTIVVSLVGALRGPAEWLDMSSTLPSLMAGTMTASDWPRLAVSTALWVLLPLAIGLWRTARRDVT